ncbi:hypothetical protein CJ030_MR0G025469 [Morella rubra]|uniref:Uncharacterized protein n=1 Tax=Morella rubra TaxID=262757 RepID=A0A6A1UF49_9ROSI|nr:hypothetical protein CJ030_MR0G025461 [Morella rubra]KAB1199282.1 hypothetical protein CJ030_MR0G025469 [Morella rubra]
MPRGPSKPINSEGKKIQNQRTKEIFCHLRKGTEDHHIRKFARISQRKKGNGNQTRITSKHGPHKSIPTSIKGTGVFIGPKDSERLAIAHLLAQTFSISPTG